MSVLYALEQGAELHKRGELLVVEKFGEVIRSAHLFKIEQIIIMGNVLLTPQTIALLLEKGIDTVFLSSRGKYRGRLVAHLGKNILLRKEQFLKFLDPAFVLETAALLVKGKLSSYLTILRRFNQTLKNEKLELSLHMIRALSNKIARTKDLDELRGIEGKGTQQYFELFRQALNSSDFYFVQRNRRPPTDPVNAMMSFGYRLLENLIHSSVNIVGMDPYLGSLHALEYGRPSLVLDLMEEFRPLLVDLLIIRLVNKKMIQLPDFYFAENPEEAEDGLPVKFTGSGMKKFITHFEKVLNREVYYPRLNQTLSYRQISLEQARWMVRHIKGEEIYQSFGVK